jgi:hypothetical protein
MFLGFDDVVFDTKPIRSLRGTTNGKGTGRGRED